MGLLRNRNFALLFAGQAASRLGDGLYVAAVAWLAWSLTHTVGTVAVVTIAANAPTFFVTLIGASYADRYDRRRLMIGTDLARCALVGMASTLLALGVLHLALLVAFVTMLAAIGAPFTPARDALVAGITPADALVTANGLLQVSFRSAFFVGPLLLAPLLAIASMPVVFGIDTLTFAVSAVTMKAINVPSASSASTGVSLRDDLVAGLAELRREPDVLVVIITFVMALTAASGFLTVGVIALVGQKLGGHGGEYGLLLGIAGVAEVFGALVIARLHLRNLARIAALAWVLLGVFRFPLGLIASPVLAAGLLAVTGFSSALTDIPLIALVQHRVPDRHLAKALGLWEAGIAGAAAISPVIATGIIDSVGVRTGFMLSGAVLVLIGTIAALALNRTRGRSTIATADGGHMRTVASRLPRVPPASDLGPASTMKAPRPTSSPRCGAHIMPFDSYGLCRQENSAPGSVGLLWAAQRCRPSPNRHSLAQRRPGGLEGKPLRPAGSTCDQGPGGRGSPTRLARTRSAAATSDPRGSPEDADTAQTSALPPGVSRIPGLGQAEGSGISSTAGRPPQPPVSTGRPPPTAPLGRAPRRNALDWGEHRPIMSAEKRGILRRLPGAAPARSPLVTSSATPSGAGGGCSHRSARRLWLWLRPEQGSSTERSSNCRVDVPGLDHGVVQGSRAGHGLADAQPLAHGVELPRGVLLGFKGSSQRCLSGLSIGTHVLLPGSYSRRSRTDQPPPADPGMIPLLQTPDPAPAHLA